MRDRPPATAPPFALRREVAVAYLAPSLTAGLGGILRGDPELTLAAFTSIGLTSAAVAAATGLWLRRRGRPRPGGPPRWTATVPRPALAAGVAAFAAVLAAADAALARGRTLAFPGRGTAAIWRAHRYAPGLTGLLTAAARRIGTR